MILFATGTTLNVMSLMGVVMMVGIVVSNSILIVEFTRRLREEGMPVARSRVARLPGALASGSDDIARHAHGPDSDGLETGTGSEAYAPLARAIIGGLAVSVVLTVFVVPRAYYILYRRKETAVTNLPANFTKNDFCALNTFQS